MLLHLRPIAHRRLARRIYRDAFYEPYASLVPRAAARRSTSPLLWVAAVAAVAMTLGLATRVVTATVAVIVAYDLFLSTTNFHNNRAYLVIVLAALAVTPCGRELSVDAWLRRRRGRAAAADGVAGLAAVAAARRGGDRLRRLRVSASCSIPDWFDGTVTWQRLNTVARPAGRVGPPGVGGRPAHEPCLQHRVRQVRHRHRAVHRRRPVVAPHALRGDLGRHLLPRRHPAVRRRRGVLVPRRRRARDLGRAVDT